VAVLFLMAEAFGVIAGCFGRRCFYDGKGARAGRWLFFMSGVAARFARDG